MKKHNKTSRRLLLSSERVQTLELSDVRTVVGAGHGGGCCNITTPDCVTSKTPIGGGSGY